MKRHLQICLLILLYGAIAISIYAAAETPNEKTKPPSSKTSIEPSLTSKENTSEKVGKEKISQKKPLGFFHSVIIYSIGDLHITQGDEADFTIEAEPKIQALIKAHVRDQVLIIEMDKASEHTQANVNYYLKLKTLKAITSYSGSRIFIKDGFETKVLSVSLLSGFGEANLNVDVTKLITKISGAGKINIQGIADEHNLTIKGIGEFIGNKLKSKMTTIKMSGSGIAKVNVSEDLLVSLTGTGTVQYCGKPNITKEIEGTGTITELDPSECK